MSTPTLIFQSKHDYNCPRADAESFHCFLGRNDVETRLVLYLRERDELSRTGKLGHVVDRIERILEWFDDQCKYFDDRLSSSGCDRRQLFYPE